MIQKIIENVISAVAQRYTRSKYEVITVYDRVNFMKELMTIFCESQREGMERFLAATDYALSATDIINLHVLLIVYGILQFCMQILLRTS